jgi:glycosyltransferase involved in cell wall biosynthesis
MRLLVISHACVTPLNQSFFADVLALTGWKLSLALPSFWKSEYKKAIRPEAWPGLESSIHPLPVMLPGNIPLHFYKSWLVGLLRQERPDAIYVHHEPYALATFQVCLANCMTGGKPMGFYAAQNILKKNPFPFDFLERWVFDRSNFAFPVTEGALSVLRTKGYRGDAHVLPLAVDTSVYKVCTDVASAKRQELGIDPDEFVIGYLGRLVEEKGLVTLLKCLKKLPFDRWRCLLVGSGPQEQMLRAMVAEIGCHHQVTFIGYVPHNQTPAWLSLFDVLVLASETRCHWKEQFGRVLLESLACGTPVVGSDSGEIPTVITKTGGGMIFPEGDADALAEKLIILREDPGVRKQLMVRGQNTVRNEYRQNHLVAQFVSTVERAVAGGSGRDISMRHEALEI